MYCSFSRHHNISTQKLTFILFWHLYYENCVEVPTTVELVVRLSLFVGWVTKHVRRILCTLSLSTYVNGGVAVTTAVACWGSS